MDKVVHRKAVPPGSLLYEQVLDDLRNNSSSFSSSSSLSSSLSSSPPLSPTPLSQSARYYYDYESRGAWHCADRNDSAGQRLENWTFHTRSTRAGANANDLKIEEVQTPTPTEMGHSTSLLLHHRHHKRDYLQHDHHHPASAPRPPGHHHHKHHDVTPPKKSSSTNPRDKAKVVAGGGCGKGHTAPNPTISNSRASRSSSLPAAASRGHVISWSASSGLDCHPRFVTESFDDLGFSLGGAHAPHSRSYPRVSSATQRQYSPSPNRARSGERRGRPQSSPPRDRGDPRSQREKGRERPGEAAGGRRKAEKSSSSTPSPRRKLFPDLRQARTKSPAAIPYLLAPSSVAFQRRGSSELPRGFTPTWSKGNSPGSAALNTSKEHIELCKYCTSQDTGDEEERNSPTDHQLPEIPDFFRMRSQSDVSMHVQRDGRLPRLPLLGQRIRVRVEEDEDEDEDENHVHVHWADEHRGSPLATSLRPRALSHGSADLPRKPILKKPIGF